MDEYRKWLIAHGKTPCVCCGIRADREDGGDGHYCHICIARGHDDADDWPYLVVNEPIP